MNGLRVVAVVVMCAALCAKAESPQEVARPVRYCDLVRDAARYDGQLVETTAFMRVTFEVMTLSAPECDDLENIAWFEFAPQYVARTRRETREELHRRLGDGRVLVTIRGVFHGPRAAAAPPGLSGPVADAVRKSRSRYGHANGYRVGLPPFAGPPEPRVKASRVLRASAGRREAEPTGGPLKLAPRTRRGSGSRASCAAG